jgi:hypothetical protein
VAQRHPAAAVIVPPRATAVPRDTAASAPNSRDRHIQRIAASGRMAWQVASGYNQRAKAEAAINRFKQVIGDHLRAQTDEGQRTEIAIGVKALNRMLGFGRPTYVRVS